MSLRARWCASTTLVPGKRISRALCIRLRDRRLFFRRFLRRAPRSELVNAALAAATSATMLRRPAHQSTDGLEQGRAQVSELVFHLRRHDGVHSASHQAVALELAKGEGQHALADALESLAEAR